MAATGVGVPSGQARQFESEGQRSSPSLVGPGFQTTKNGRILVLRQTSISRPSSVGSASATSDSNASSSGGGGGRGPRRNHDICVGEELRIAVDRVLDRFRRTEDYEEVEFPSSLTAVERAYVHRLASTLGLRSKSHGKGAARILSVTKKSSNASACAAANLKLRMESVHWVNNLLQKYPLSSKERQDLVLRSSKATEVDGLKDLFKNVTGRLNNGLPQIPPPKSDSPLSTIRQSLPISQYQSEILDAVQSHQVTLIVGETGSGKTTQVPQMILEDSHERRCPCRIICTQPRRIAALSIAERVAAERGEKVGQTVGYQIRLESRVSPKTLLTFCTNGVLLRTLMANAGSLDGVTHVIVDEVHERDKYSDFLLICMQLALARFRHLKLINMSASLNVDVFMKYFEGCGLVKTSDQSIQRHLT